ncbi:MAG: tRNA (adenine-N1)-methyltransferase, partial [SAR202 cluster bacterium]|nr:tRNA (adenine-N1)-methyltransferase [SAR202 cluster bacterium]
KKFSSHVGAIFHADLIGKPVGCRIETNKGHRLLALRPTMADFTRLMPRTATPVYPKDLAAIVVQGDIFPGARVLEAGTGSGALTIALSRAVGERGRVFTYDVREDMLERAKGNIARALGNFSNVVFKLGDITQAVEERDVDRVVLDMPEPWPALPHIESAMVPGGVLTTFLPTVLQVHEMAVVLRSRGTFDLIETVEVLMRTWSVGNRSVRPDHRMVAHTGFITTARLCEPWPQGQGDDGDGGDENGAEEAGEDA